LPRSVAEFSSVSSQADPATSHHDLARELNAAGHRTGLGQPFTPKAVQWIRHAYRVPPPGPYAPGEVSVSDAAARLGVSIGVVYYWIETKQLSAHRGRGNRLCIPWSDDVEAACRNRITDSCHLKPTNPIATAGEAV
jgi:excisionase family DNA binding protein